MDLTIAPDKRSFFNLCGILEDSVSLVTFKGKKEGARSHQVSILCQ